jgi:hypothetical protein
MRPNAVAVAVRRMRERYGALVRQEISVESISKYQEECSWFGLIV